jgi:hypothetical protein
VRNWLTDQAIKAVFDRLEKNPIRIGGVDKEGRDLILWVVPSKTSSKKSSKKG